MAGDEAVSRRGIALLAPAREKVKFFLGRYKRELVDVPQIPADGGVEGCSCHSDPLVLRARAISISAGRDGGLRRGPQTQASSDFSQAEGLAYFSIGSRVFQHKGRREHRLPGLAGTPVVLRRVQLADGRRRLRVRRLSAGNDDSEDFSSLPKNSTRLRGYSRHIRANGALAYPAVIRSLSCWSSGPSP